MSTTFQILTQGRVYIYNRRYLEFEVTIEKAHRLLQGQSKSGPDNSTFDALYNGIATNWVVRDDVVKPFGDRRKNLRFVCTFNLDQDCLVYSDEDGHIQLPLARLRKTPSDPPQRSDFTPFDVPSPPQPDFDSFTPPYHKTSAPICKRRFEFVSRVLADFADQWRHILRSCYTDSIFRRLAKAIIDIATCNFRVEEKFLREHIYGRFRYVDVLDVPSWEPYDGHLFRVGRTTVVLNQDLNTALDMAKDEVKKSSKVMKPGDEFEQHMYLLLSVRHIILCHVDSKGSISYTAPTALMDPPTTPMDGIDLPSPTAINLLLQALSPARPPPYTPIHNLPLELQDRILLYVSHGPIEAARLGCTLGLGSPFNWMRPIDWPRREGPVQLLLTPSHRSEGTPVESKIYFGDVFSGVSYR
ncbi:hypothetical protein BKA64DRAFT_643277 [Cadophora sp. MPI-SDFR-AT-0126]|nr:hypothetical protein BKA64DRAFT_643277 [Leotiomycetes sp. MPI-SDFR-AT-0126]